ncbi:MAG: cupin domain-containing protein [Ignavibacteriae bacterium]|nr:MAG: cupin domain-containing protein [Ignavibacteriota bacterium]
MAFKGKIIQNTKTGQDIKFIQTAKDTNGKLLEMESTYNSHSKEPVSHYHPLQEEEFTVLSGELYVRINGQVKILKQGDILNIPKNVVHSMWNDSDSKTVVNWKVFPALNTEYLLELGTGLANDGKTNDGGMPNILQVALMANRFSKAFRITKPPFIIQKIVFTILTPIAYLSGYRPIYKKYID